MNTQVFYDPILFGPGMWYQIHSDSLLCNTLILKQHFVITINALCNHFRCDDCKIHFRNFIDTHPIQNYFNVKDLDKDVGIFKWTWELHNHVNQRLGKYQPTFKEAYDFYTNEPVQPVETVQQTTIETSRQAMVFQLRQSIIRAKTIQRNPKNPPRVCNSCNKNKLKL